MTTFTNWAPKCLAHNIDALFARPEGTLLPSVQLGPDPNCTIFATFVGNMKQIEVVAAIIHDADGRIFATQRGYGDFKDFWEFPGGAYAQGARGGALVIGPPTGQRQLAAG